MRPSSHHFALAVALAAACSAPRRSSAPLPQAGSTTFTSEGSGAAAEEPAPPPITSAEAFGARVEDLQGRGLGSLEDLFIDPATGVVKRLSVHTGVGGVLELAWSDVHWSRRGDELVLLVVSGRADATRGGDPLAERAPETLAGEIVSTSEITNADGAVALQLTLRARNNHFHRVDLGPCEGRPPLPVPLMPGQALELSGHFTRDAEGKLFVANRLNAGGEARQLRALPADASEPLLARQRPRSLAGVSVETADGTLVELTGFVIDPVTAALREVYLRVDGVPRALPWRRLHFDQEAGWRAEASLAWLRAQTAREEGL